MGFKTIFKKIKIKKTKRGREIMNFDRLKRYFLRSPRFLVIVMFAFTKVSATGYRQSPRLFNLFLKII